MGRAGSVETGAEVVAASAEDRITDRYHAYGRPGVRAVRDRHAWWTWGAFSHRFTIASGPARFAKLGDLHEGIDDSAYRLDTLQEWAERDGLD